MPEYKIVGTVRLRRLEVLMHRIVDFFGERQGTRFVGLRLFVGARDPFKGRGDSDHATSKLSQ
jgi:hypothetical protein